MLTEWQQVTIGVVSRSRDDKPFEKKWRKFATETEATFSQSQSPFDPEHVKRLWEAHIRREGIGERVTCVICPRPFNRNFAVLFPPERYRMTYPEPTAQDCGTDATKVAILSKLMSRTISTVKPPFMLHNSEIKKRVRAGESWEKFLAPGTDDDFRVILEKMKVTAIAICET